MANQESDQFRSWLHTPDGRECMSDYRTKQAYGEFTEEYFRAMLCIVFHEGRLSRSREVCDENLAEMRATFAGGGVVTLSGDAA